MASTQGRTAVKAATIQDVANRAGVSIKTVSRVTNDVPHVRAETRRRVREAISELDYRPNPQAVYLGRMRTHSRTSA